jgi:hypothetical protein
LDLDLVEVRSVRDVDDRVSSDGRRGLFCEVTRFESKAGGESDVENDSVGTRIDEEGRIDRHYLAVPPESDRK